MQVLLDKMVASFIAIALFLLISQFNVRNEKAKAETTAFYAVTAQSESFAQTLRRDLQGVVRVVDVAPLPAGNGTTKFEFVTRIGNDPTERTIRYLQVPEAIQRRDPATGQVVTETFYRIERYVDASLVPEGGSATILTDWNIEARNNEGNPVADPNSTEQVFVSFEAASPYMVTKTMEGITWVSTFFPPLRNI